MTEQATIDSSAPGNPSVEDQAAAFAKENPDAAKAVGMDVPEEPEGPQRPEHIPEKFWDAEKGEVRVDDMAKSYAELEKNRSKPKEDDAPSSIETPSDAEEADAAAEEAVEEAGLDLNTLSEKWAEQGDLDDSDYEALKKVGISKQDVEVYIRGREAIATEFSSKVYEAAGGEDTYNAAIAWAADNYSEAKIEAFNKALQSGDVATAEVAVEGLLASYRASEGSPPSRVVTGEASGSAAVGFQSQAEMMEAIRNPEYQSNPAYRERVRKRLEASPASVVGA